VGSVGSGMKVSNFPNPEKLKRHEYISNWSPLGKRLPDQTRESYEEQQKALQHGMKKIVDLTTGNKDS